MTLEELERLSRELEDALDQIVDERDRWRDVPPCYFDPDDGWGDRFEMQCSFCGARFWPVFWDDCDFRCGPFYYQAGYWFGNPGQGHHFPVCSDGCYGSLERQLGRRMLHTKAEMEKVGRARRLISECKATVRRIKREKRSKGRPPVHPGGS